ncbi:MAG: hypothetical protein KDD70_17825, partial [Bdellovibrionales bacterium]|nr:hypothetical protein [Bdellovibrionales bacterium]
LPNLDDPKFIPKNSDQVALLESAGYARRAPNGDILHDIEGNAQLLESIANWYMGSAKLVPLLRDANSFPDSQRDARKGVVIRIPLEYVKKTKRMPINHRVAAVEEAIPAPAPKSTKKEKVGMEAIVAEDAPELLQNS